MRKHLIILTSFVIISFGILLGYERPGSTSAQFLNIGVTPRARSMNDAFISISEGAEVTYYNPAGMAWFKKTNFILSHTEWFANINHNFLGVTHNFGRYGAAGFLLTSFITDEMKVRTPLQPHGTGETFYSGNYRIGAAYALRMTDHVSFGTTLNYIYSSLYQDLNEDAYSVDISVLYRTNFRNFNFGMKIEHFGSEMKFVNEAYPLPTNFQFGASIDAVSTSQYDLLVAASARKPNDGDPIGSFGTEFSWNEMFFIRGGYSINHQVRSYSTGFGAQFKAGNKILKFDYAYCSYKSLGGVNSFSISLGI